MKRKLSESGGIMVLESDFEDASQLAIQLMRELGQSGNQSFKLNHLQGGHGGPALVRPLRAGENANNINPNGGTANSNSKMMNTNSMTMSTNSNSFTSDFRLVSLQECDAIQSRAQTQTTLFYLIVSLGSLFFLAIVLVYAYIRSENRATQFRLEKLRRDQDIGGFGGDGGGDNFGSASASYGNSSMAMQQRNNNYPNIVGKSTSGAMGYGGGSHQAIELPTMLSGMTMGGRDSRVNNTYTTGGYRSVLMQEAGDENHHANVQRGPGYRPGGGSVALRPGAGAAE
jgi:hypothetical protein